jgi:two-component system OmpR family sensor kinase
VAGGVLNLLRLLGGTARSITETDLTRRIPVEGDDGIAELARTFNAMLDRLQTGFANQRRFVDDAAMSRYSSK